jgi:hypothetical protein
MTCNTADAVKSACPKSEQIIKDFVINSMYKVLNSLEDKPNYNFQ